MSPTKFKVSSIAMDDPVLTINDGYSRSVLQYQGFEITNTRGWLHQIRGFAHYNALIDVNAVFSQQPRFDPVDRTHWALAPVRFAVPRPWQVPQQEFTLEAAMQQRVLSICNRGQRINLLWSGGIDSTAILAAFLQYAPDRSQLRVIYSPWSVYEHPDMMSRLQTMNHLELLDISGNVYLDTWPDGIWISGNTGDESHASLDESFVQQHGFDALDRPWQDFFIEQNCSYASVELFEQHAAHAGRPIRTVLEARWWFYISCKQNGILYAHNLPMFVTDTDTFDPGDLVGFFACDEYESFVWHNIDQIIPEPRYDTWRQFLKDFCYKWDGCWDWYRNKTKLHSKQLPIYQSRRQIMHDQRHIMIMQSGKIVSTPNLPFLNQQEWLAVEPQVPHAFRSAV